MTDHDPRSGRPIRRVDVRVRFAPSPVGDLHVGDVRTALYSWAFAPHTGGAFVLSVEDTEADPGTAEHIDGRPGNAALARPELGRRAGSGGPYGPYRQSERVGHLPPNGPSGSWTTGHAYRCYCSQEELRPQRREAARKAGGPSGYDGYCRTLTPDQIAAYLAEGRQPVLRFRMPDGSTTFTDLVRGEITFDHTTCPTSCWCGPMATRSTPWPPRWTTC